MNSLWWFFHLVRAIHPRLLILISSKTFCRSAQRAWRKCLRVNTSIKVCSFCEFSFFFLSCRQYAAAAALHAVFIRVFLSFSSSMLKNEHEEKFVFPFFFLAHSAAAAVLPPPRLLGQLAHNIFSTTHSYNKLILSRTLSRLIFIKKLPWHSTVETCWNSCTLLCYCCSFSAQNGEKSENVCERL